MRIPVFQVDAFTDRLFYGNPAAVCPLERWLPDDVMQKIAMENNLSETAFFVPESEGYRLRWFTPACEVDLCGHATLAAAYVIFNSLRDEISQIRFDTRSGHLQAVRLGQMIQLDFPADPPLQVDSPAGLDQALGTAVLETWMSHINNYLLVLVAEQHLQSITVDIEALAGLQASGVIVTAPGTDCDFVSRFFAPRLGVPEDPVTGSAHCVLMPYWAKRLGKKQLHARQLSARGGELFCELRGERVLLAGTAVQFLHGFLEVQSSK